MNQNETCPIEKKAAEMALLSSQELEKLFNTFESRLIDAENRAQQFLHNRDHYNSLADKYLLEMHACRLALSKKENN